MGLSIGNVLEDAPKNLSYRLKNYWQAWCMLNSQRQFTPAGMSGTLLPVPIGIQDIESFCRLYQIKASGKMAMHIQVLDKLWRHDWISKLKVE